MEYLGSGQEIQTTCFFDTALGTPAARHGADTYPMLGFTPSRCDPDVWYQLDGTTDLYEYIGTHTDDLMVMGPPGLPNKLITT